MSWFDASGFASLAKSALKEAQKTIDKALDIQDEEQKTTQTPSSDKTDFFATWGVKNDEQPEEKSDLPSQKQQSSSIWGSFTGSFFENPKLDNPGSTRPIKQSKSLQESLDNSLEELHVSSSSSVPESLSSECPDESSKESENSNLQKKFSKLNLKSIGEEAMTKNLLEVERIDSCPESEVKKLDLNAVHTLKRISIISYESDKKSSESVEILGSQQNTDCTTTPESEVNSVSQSLSLSLTGPKVNSESVEILPDSLVTSPSSVEVLGDWKSDSSLFLSPIEQRQSSSERESSAVLQDAESYSDISPYESPMEEAKSCSLTFESKTTGSCSVNQSSSNVNQSSNNDNQLSNVVSQASNNVKQSANNVKQIASNVKQSTSNVKQSSNDVKESLNDTKESENYVKESENYVKESENDVKESESGVKESKNGVKQSSNDVKQSENYVQQSENDVQESENAKQVSDNVNQSSNSDNQSFNSAGTLSIQKEAELKCSPDSVEVIPDVDESDEVSLAEDSYTSASETTVMTILESFQDARKREFSDSSLKMHDSFPDSHMSMNSSVEYPLNISLDSIKEKHNLHLPLEPITTQPIRKADYLESVKNIAEIDPFEQLKSSTIEPSEPETFVENVTSLKADTEGPDQYLMLTDSSCEGTLIESSSEDNATLVGTESKITEAPLTSSSYVKSMLADAMYEKSDNSDTERHCIEVPRENSPISSESRSDLVKIGSDQTSGHTSGDELETTTSSDIEIISSPNGDSSSTQSRQSPAKLHLNKSSDLLTKALKTRGHSRELSEISIGSDDTNLEIEKLLKRIQEMTEILEARESKLIDVSRMNMELHDQNNGLKRQLDSVEKHVEQNQDLTQLTDEYTQRLSALERKFQQAIRDRDLLRKNLEQLKQETASRISSMEMSSISAEKDEVIKELREEGEKLSKQQLQHSNIIKKLRAKEKENESTIKSQKEQLEEQGLELDRLKRSLYAKEEVERSQIEAVHSLTAKNKKQEKEIFSLQEKLDHALNKMDVYKKSFNAAKVELSDTKENLLTAQEELKHAVDTAGDSCQLLAQVEDLRIKLRHAEEAVIKKEETLKQENHELLKRLEMSETRSEEISESVSSATKPLLRQLEQLQANLLQKTNNFMKQEKIMSEKIIELQTKLENLVETDQCLKEDNLNLKSRVSTLESKLHAKEIDRAKLEDLSNESKLKNDQLSEENKKYQETIKIMEQSQTNQIKELKREINSLENKLSMEKAATDAEKRKNSAIMEQQQSVEEEFRLSPTLSIERDSMSSVNSIWPVFNDPMFDSSSGRFPNVYESLRAGSSSTSVFENLQSQLKQREGEIQQLQWELSRRNAERDTLNLELSSLSLKVEELNSKVTEVEALNENLNDIQTKYDALLQMYGEKVEENQELRLDLEDVKEMYKTQIDQLLKRDT